MDDDAEVMLDAEDVLELALDDAIDPPPPVTGDERRMHVRAYNWWVGMLGSDGLPDIAELDIAGHPEFAGHAVLLDLTDGPEEARVAWLGDRLRGECGLDTTTLRLADVPPRSLLSRLTDHHLQIVANRAPVGFEAEFVNSARVNTAYRGILMPFTSDGLAIDWVLGVINWKEMPLLPELAQLQAQFSAAAAAPTRAPAGLAWPHDERTQADAEDADDAADWSADTAALPEAPELADLLAAARDGADAFTRAEVRTRAALYGALDLAYDFALTAEERPDDYQALLADSGLAVQARAPLTPLVKLVFGADYDKTRLTEFAAAIAFAKRHQLPRGGLKLFLERWPGGLKAVVQAERRARAPARPARIDPAREAARKLEGQLTLTLPGDDEFVLLVARRVDGERVTVIGVAPDDKPLVDRALKGLLPERELNS